MEISTAISSAPKVSCGSNPALRSWRSLCLTRELNSPAALRVKVRPRISSGRTTPFATSHKTRWVIVSVLPDPAPAITTVGPQCLDSIIARCSSVGSRNFAPASASALAISIARISRSNSIFPSTSAAFVERSILIRSHSDPNFAMGRGLQRDRCYIVYLPWR